MTGDVDMEKMSSAWRATTAPLRVLYRRSASGQVGTFSTHSSRLGFESLTVSFVNLDPNLAWAVALLVFTRFRKKLIQ